MLKLAPVGPGGEGYYYDTVLAVSDQPDGLIEADPVWMGRMAAERWPDAGSPTLADAQAILGGIDPSTGEILADRVRYPAANVAHDVMLSVPKGVSLAYVLGGPEATAAIGTVLEDAVAATLGYIEDEIVLDRKGARPAGVSALAFVHRTSRSNDPHLHTHMLIVNLVCRADGKFGAIDSRRLYRAQTTCRLLFEAQIRNGLTALGIPLGAMRHGFADIAGLEPYIEAFSRRSSAIADLSAAGASRFEILRERPAKDRSKSVETLLVEWDGIAADVGCSAQQVQRALGGLAGPAQLSSALIRYLAPSPGSVTDGWVAAAADPVDGTFTRVSLIQSRCKAAPAGVSVGEVMAEVDRVLGRGELILCGRHYGADRFRTPERHAELCATADELATRGQAVGATILSHPPGGRAEALAELGAIAASSMRTAGLETPVQTPTGTPASLLGSIVEAAALASTPTGAPPPVLAVAPGERVAVCFEGATGIPTVPIGRLETADMGERLLIVADGAGFTAAEHRRVVERCERGGAQLLMFGAEGSFERRELLQPLRQAAARRVELMQATPPVAENPSVEPMTIAMGPRASAVLVPDQLDAVEAVRTIAQQHPGCVVVAPDRALAEAIGPGTVDPSTARARLAARRDSPGAERVAGAPPPPAAPTRPTAPTPATAPTRPTAPTPPGAPATPVVVTIGGAAPLAMSAEDLARYDRVHVLIGPSFTRDGETPDLGRVGEAVRPGHLTKALGKVPRAIPERVEWCAGAALVERHRLVHGIEHEPDAYGRHVASSPTRSADKLTTQRAVDEAMPMRQLARSRTREPGRSIGR